MCYVVVLNYKIGTCYPENIAISMSDSLDPDDTPENINFFITSRNNQFGIVHGHWLEGNVFEGTMPYKKRHLVGFDLKQIKVPIIYFIDGRSPSRNKHSFFI